MSLLSGRKTYTSLEDNKKYTAKLISMTEYEADEAHKSDDSLGFITFKWELSEDGRAISDSRNVPVGTDILARQLADQLKAKNIDVNGKSQEKLFELIGKDQLEFDLWVTRRVKDDVQYTNYSFQAPIVKPSTTAQPEQRAELSE